MDSGGGEERREEMQWVSPGGSAFYQRSSRKRKQKKWWGDKYQRITQEKNFRTKQQEFPDLKGKESVQNNG